MFNTQLLGNNKFFSGSYKNFTDTRGWFLGSFMDVSSPLKTDQIEILYKEHTKGDLQSAHYHKLKIELLIFLKGSAKYKINDTEVLVKAGDFLFVDVNNVISGEYLEDSAIFAIHSPSIPADKFDV